VTAQRGDEYARSVHTASLAVVIPAWNAERYLGEAIESVLAQDVRPRTIVVVDDGSTDGTADVARRYPGVRLVRQEHAGAGAARNTGLARCDEDVVAFLDADDVWLPAKLTLQLARLAEPGVDAVFGRVENFVSPDREAALAAVAFERRALSGFVPSALVTTRAVCEQVGPFATGEALTDWVDWYLRLVDGGAGIAVVDEVVVRRRVHGDNQTMREAGARTAYVRLVKASLDRRRAQVAHSPPAAR
jgi:glycosyltransferase involved in cell wall biosynthesis